MFKLRTFSCTFLFLSIFNLSFYLVGQSVQENIDAGKRKDYYYQDKRLENERIEQNVIDQKIENERLERKRQDDIRLQKKLDDERWDRAHGRL